MKFYKFFSIFVILSSFCAINFDLNIANAAVNTPVKQQSTVTYSAVSPISVVDNPNKYLNKNIMFTAEFVGFCATGLDYKPAYREASKYIGVLIKRDDVTSNVIPLSEMKIFLPRKLAEKHMDLEQGDKIKISGNVFSVALGDPWVDVKEFDVLTKKDKTDKK